MQRPLKLSSVSHFGIIVNWTIHTQDIKKDLSQQFPELESINVVVPFIGNRPVVYIEASKTRAGADCI